MSRQTSSYQLELERQRIEAGFDPLLLAKMMGSMAAVVWIAVQFLGVI